MTALRGPLGWVLVAVVAVAALLAAQDYLAESELKAAAREREIVTIATQARELMALRGLVAQMKNAATPTEPLSPVVERVAASEGVTVTSTQGAGEVDEGPYRERRVIVRIGAATLGPFKRFLGRLEAAQPGLLVRELTIRRTIGRTDRLDAELVLGQIDPTAAAQRTFPSTRSASSPRGAASGSSGGSR